MKINSLILFILLAGKNLLAGEPLYPTGFEPKKQNQSITFTENKGQVSDQNNKPRPDVLFGGNANGMVFHLRNNGISYQLNRVDTWKLEDTLLIPHHRLMPEEKRKVPDQISIYRIDMNWLNCNKNPVIETGETFEGYTNYYQEACPNGVHHVRSFKEVTYKNIYKGIDLHFYEKEGALKYDYIIAPKADYKKIQIMISGATKIHIEKNGSARIQTPLGEIREDAPIVYQQGRRLQASWVKQGSVLTFAVAGYDTNHELIIDPLVRFWGTYYGGNNDDKSFSCCLDGSGNIYMAGECRSNLAGTIIATSGAHQATHGGGVLDAFIAKFNSSGSRLWATYYGGNGADRAWSCETDNSGNVYMTGQTSSTNSAVMATPGCHQLLLGGMSDAFLVKFDANGVRLWSTYYGGTGIDEGFSCATDALGNIIVSGQTGSNREPLLPLQVAISLQPQATLAFLLSLIAVG